MNIMSFKSGQNSAVADSSLKTSVRTMDGAKHHAVLWFADIIKRGLFRDLGYSNMPAYATGELNFSKTRLGDFMRLTGKLDALPAVKKSLIDGELGYTKVVEIIKVATPATQETWVAEAAQTGRRELAQKVKRVRAKANRRKSGRGQATLLAEPKAEDKLAAAVPVRLALEMTPEQFARFEALLERVRKIGAVSAGADRTDILLAGLEELAGGTSSDVTTNKEKDSAKPTRRRVSSPPFQIHVHKCPDCEKASVQTGRGELEISAAEAKRAACDARIDHPGRRNTATIPPKRRAAVLRRDRHRCRAPGCGHSRFLEVHHVKPRLRGGGHDLENLVTLCSGCHRLHHEGRLRL